MFASMNHQKKEPRQINIIKDDLTTSGSPWFAVSKMITAVAGLSTLRLKLTMSTAPSALQMRSHYLTGV